MNLTTPFFPEPVEDGFTASYPKSTLDFVSHSQSSYAIQARLNLNTWIEVWPKADDVEIFGKLRSSHNAHFEGACWELYLNWLFLNRGFVVTKLEAHPGVSTPDFLVTTQTSTFIVEATSRYIATNALWDNFVNSLREVRRGDFFLSIRLEEIGQTAPSVRAAKRQIETFLARLNPQLDSSVSENLPSFVYENSGWVIRMTAHQINQGGPARSVVGTWGESQVFEVKDTEALRKQIEKKRKKYQALEYPLVIAVLENSFVVDDDNFHRLNALFGDLSYRIRTDGKSETVRSDNGLWSARDPDRRCSALILSSELRIGDTILEAPGLWVNPWLESPGVDVLTGGVVYGKVAGGYGPRFSDVTGIGKQPSPHA